MSAPFIHIYRPRGHYIGQVRLFGHRRWQTVTGRCAKAETAIAKAINKMTPNHKRARALFIDDSGWHEAHICMEAAR